jgi:predicted nucleic acid-binding protein
LTFVLADTGPIVAFLNRRDRHHGWAVERFRSLRAPLLTCEAVLSESVFLLGGVPGGAERVMDLVGRGVLRVSFALAEESASVGGLLRRYRSLPMDLADACLVRMSELHADCLVLTIDSEFRNVYRRHGRQVIPTLLPAGQTRRRRTPTAP